MKALRLLILLTACCATGTLWAAETAPVKPATPAAAKPAEKPAAESAAPKEDEEPVDKVGEEAAATPKSAASAADKSAADKGKGKGSSPQRFVPSEQVRADFDVSFPIDI